MHFLESMRREVMRTTPYTIRGEVVGITGMAVTIAGISHYISVGERCFLERVGRTDMICEIIGVDKANVTAMPFGTLDGIGVGDRVKVTHSESVIYPTEEWLGRVVDAFGNILDDKGTLPIGDEAFPIRTAPPPAHQRRRMGEKLSLGVRALDCFIPCCKGQRLGIFAGSGVGKSILLSMLARNSSADVIVFGMVGERGREVREFLETALGDEGMKRCVIVVATSDEPALCRKQAAFTAMSVAEYFRSIGKDVLLLLDSVTRFAMALREIGLSVGEPPATKGYPPSVFTELPKLLERAGTGRIKPSMDGKFDGNITGLFTVLVEGDDHNEPISDAIRGILDGHVVLSRAIAQKGHYPAIDVLHSVSRALPACNTAEENNILQTARDYINTYEEMADLISLGTYRKGTDAKTDKAIDLHQTLDDFLRQDSNDYSSLHESFVRLAEILSLPFATEAEAAQQGAAQAATPVPQPPSTEQQAPQAARQRAAPLPSPSPAPQQQQQTGQPASAETQDTHILSDNIQSHA